MRTRRPQLTAVGLALFSALGAVAFSLASEPPFSLRDAVRFALENSPTFDTAKKTQAIRELEYRNAVAKMLPSADATAVHGLQNNVPIAGTPSVANPTAPWYSSLNLGLTESLYDNGVSLTQASIADLNRDLAAITYMKARDSLTLDVTLAFYRFSLSTILLDVRKQQQTVLEKQFRTLTSQYQQGFKTKADYLRLKTQVQRAEIDRITAENSIELASAELQRLLGAGYGSPSHPSFQPISIQLDAQSNDRLEDSFPEKPPAFEDLYDSRITRLQEEVNGKAVTLARRNYWPQVSLTSGVTYSNSNYLNSGTPFTATHQLSWNALVTVQYNFWDWGTRSRSVQVSEYNRDIQQNGLHQGLLDIGAQITNLMVDLSRIKRNYKLSRELLDLEQESNHNVESQYREGKVTYLDLITSLNSLLDAKVQYYTAHFDALQGIAKHQYFEGKIYEALAGK